MSATEPPGGKRGDNGDKAPVPYFLDDTDRRDLDQLSKRRDCCKEADHDIGCAELKGEGNEENAAGQRDECMRCKAVEEDTG